MCTKKWIYTNIPTYANLCKGHISQEYPTFPFKEWPTLWPQHRQQQKNPRKKISRWHGRTGQQETGSGQGGCWLIACSIFWKTQSVYLIVWICDIFWFDSCVFVRWKSSNLIYVMLVGSWGPPRSIDKHEKSLHVTFLKVCVAAWKRRFWITKKLFVSREIGPQDGLNQSGVWLLTHRVIFWTYL